MAQRPIIQVFMDILSSYNGLQDLLEEARKKNPEGMETAAFKILGGYAADREETAGSGPEESGPEGGGPERETGAPQDRQRISTLEDQLGEEKQRSQGLEDQIQALRTQVQAYEQYMERTETRDTGPRDAGPGESEQGQNEQGQNEQGQNEQGQNEQGQNEQGES